MTTKLNQISTFFLGVLMSGILLLGVALADDVVNNLDTTIDSIPETTTTTVGAPITVGYYINATTGSGDVAGCNVDSSNPATLTITPPPGVTVNDSSSASLAFTNCEEVKYVTYKSNIPDTYNINASNYSISGGKPGSKWNVTTAAFKLIVLAPSDNTPPVIVPTISPQPNIWGWNNTDVTVSWSVTDPESGIISTEGCATTTLTEETYGITLTCTATSLGGTASSSVTIKIDKTKPVITATRTPEPNEHGWNNTDVTVSFMCTDTGDVQSGIATDTVTTGEPVTVSTEGAGQSVTSTGSCIDYAGNEADPATVSNINIDKTPPEITINTPEDGKSYTFKQTILADWSATDTLSGIDTATGTVPSGDPIDTSSIGTKSFTVTATDLAGNTLEKTVSYNVVPYDFVGFGAPLNIDSKKFKQNSTIPVKFKLFDTLGNPVSNATATLWVKKGDDEVPAVSSGGSNTGNYFRYDPINQQYIFNLSTKQLESGTNTLVVELDDGTSHELTIEVR